MTTVYETLERPLVPVLAQMEMAGVKVDRDTLSRMSNGFAQKMAGLEDEIQTLAGRKFQRGLSQAVGRDPVRRDGSSDARREEAIDGQNGGLFHRC